MSEQKDFSALKTRRSARTVFVGNVGIGGQNPIRVQTMTNTDTFDCEATAKQVFQCYEAGSELVRISTPQVRHVHSLEKIRSILKKKYGCNVPLIADIHFSPEAAFEALKYADKIRLNPGNLLDSKIKNQEYLTDSEYAEELKRVEKGLIPFIDAAKKFQKPIRIGSNQGSLSGRILGRYGNTPLGMVESTMEYLRIFHKHSYDDIIVALKSSDPLAMIEANRLLAFHMEIEGMDYPIHLGVTEAGNAEDGRAKSTIGIGTLLLEGIGDTLRVSLTEPPEKEIPVCYSILQASRRRITKTEFISCPSCGRTLFDIEKVANHIKEKMSHLKGVKIAIMGCIVNGPGEMADADFGYVGGQQGKITLYFHREPVKYNIPEEEAIDELIKLIKSKGMWV